MPNPIHRAATSGSARLNGLSDQLLDSRRLPNGLRLLTSPMPHTRSATISIYVGAGSRYEADQDAGISHMVEHVCFKGTERWPTAQQISEAIEGVGGVLNAATDRELTVYYAKVPRDHLELALGIVTDMVIHPLFDKAELDKERNVIVEELAAVEDNPAQLVELDLDQLLWPDHPLGRDVAGTPDTVKAIPHQRVVDYHRRQYGPRNTLIAVAGAVDPDAVARSLETLTATWEFDQPDAWTPVAPLSSDHERVNLRTKDTEQANVMIGLPGLDADHPDRYALSLIAGVLGEGMSSRLFLKIREELGLAYDVNAYASTMHDTGVFAIYLGVDPDNTMAAIRATLDQLGHIRDGITAAELTKIREYIKGRMLLNMEDTRAVSSWYGAQTLLLDRTRSVDEVVADVEAVTLDDLARVADTLIRDNCLHLAVVGPFETDAPFRDALHL